MPAKPPIKKAMLLAAGRGERLRPLTDHCPKPLLEVQGEPLLVHHLKRLERAGFEQVVINLGWLGDQIPTTLAKHLNHGRYGTLTVTYSQEPPGALETAGGVRHALHHFGHQPFAMISSDVLIDTDYRHLTGLAAGRRAHLLLVDNPPHHLKGDFVLNQGLVERQGTQNSSQRTLTYSGVGLFDPALFRDLTPGHRALRPVLEQAIDQQLVTGERFMGHWLDIGTLERYDDAQTLSWVHPQHT